MPDSRAVRALLSLGMVVSLGATGTYAYWTDSVQVTGTTITAGTIDLDVDNQDSVNNFTQMNITNMVPGNSVAGVLTVNNNGTAPLRYYVNASYSNVANGLGAALVVKVTGDTATGGSGAAKTCPGAPLADSSSGFTPNMLGSAALPRQLTAGGSEKICIQATLPTNASTSLQGASTSVTFSFSGSSF